MAAITSARSSLVRSRRASTASSGSMAPDSSAARRRFRLAEQRGQLLGIHLLQGVGRLLGGESGRATSDARAASRSSSRSASSPGRSRSRPSLVVRSRTSGASPRSVSPKGWMAPQSMTRSGVGVGRHRAGPEPPQQGLGRHVHADQAEPAEQRRQVQIGRPDDLHAVDVDQLVVEDLIGQGHLAGREARSRSDPAGPS